jgi:hypothetical protein
MIHGPAQPQVNLSLMRSNSNEISASGLGLPPSIQSHSPPCTYYNTDHWLLLVRRKLPYTHWFSLEIHVIGTERRAQIHLFNVCKYNRIHGQNLRSNPVKLCLLRSIALNIRPHVPGVGYLVRIFIFFMKTPYLQGDHFTLKVVGSEK